MSETIEEWYEKLQSATNEDEILIRSACLIKDLMAEREKLKDDIAKYKIRRIIDMAKYEIRDIHKAIDGLLDERFEMAAQAKTLLGETTDDQGRTVQIQLCLEARPEMFMPMEPEAPE